ncbi:class I SAM-dependent methyltransferase [Roseivirga pacifica]
MSEQAVNDNIFTCPFTSRQLKPLSVAELVTVNAQVAQNQLCFYSGVPVRFKLEKAYASDNHLYIYPVIDDILLLQKDTAVVAKNRTENPFLRVSEHKVEEFYSAFNFSGDKAVVASPSTKPLATEELKSLKNLLPKSGSCFLSAFSEHADSILNLEFGTQFDHYVHLDYNIDRIRSVKEQLSAKTIYVLAEMNDLPFADASIDAFFSFDFINNYEKDFQHMAYDELKRALSPSGASVVLYDKAKPMHAGAKRKNELLSKKALSYVAPWKKVKVPTIHFHPMSDASNSNATNVVAKTSLGRQLS